VNRRAAVALVVALLGLGLAAASPAAAALDEQQCMAQRHERCYSPTQVQHAYGVDRLHRADIDGRGTRIAIIMAPAAGVRASVAGQSRRWHLPPARLTITEPAGPAGPPGTGIDAAEGTLDVQATHLMAPRAHLLYLAVPAPAIDGSVLLDQPIATAVDAAVRAHADVISMSFGGLEQAYPATRAAIARAVRAGVPVLAGSGDSGVTFPGSTGLATSFPATDPYVTAVGGTLVTLDGRGNRLIPDIGWGPDARGGASGGGLSLLDGLPSWQRGYPGIFGTKRNYPDVSMLGATSGRLILSFSPAAQFTRAYPGGLFPVGGTSVGTPLLAGVLALARQVGGHPLHDVNAALYRLAAHGARRNGIVDVVLGNNSASDDDGNAVSGYLATTGYDRVTGLGTIDAPRFVPAIADATR
jgi:subtilase family serine protease